MFCCVLQSTSFLELHDMKSPPIHSHGSDQIDFYQLIASLKRENEIEFLGEINSIAEDRLAGLFRAVDNNNSLLTFACEKGLITAVETMLRLGADINGTIDTTRGPLTPVESACHFGNWKVLDLLLKSPKLDLSRSEPLLSIVVKNIGEKETAKCNYEKCFQLLLDHEQINVNKLDVFGCSALHYAAKFNNTNAMLELLKRGAYIGQRNFQNQFPISNMNPEVLEKHFDHCIKTNNLRAGEDNFEVQFNYANLVPVPPRVETNKKSSDEEVEFSPNEMIAIEYISESNELRHLIRHPLIASFLFLKWNQLALIFYLNFILCLLFAVSTAIFTLIYQYPDPQDPKLQDPKLQDPEFQDFNDIKCLMRIVSSVLTLYMIGREVSQFRLSPLTYCRSVENYMECAMIGLVVIVLFDIPKEDWRRTIAASAILLIGIEVFHLAGSLPFWSFSTHYLMLKTVITSFLKSLSLYAILLLAFSLAFFTLLRERPKWLTERGQIEEGELNKFSNLGLSIVKTLVMSTGEFDAADINFELNPWSYFIFIAFLFVISTVLLNLLNGLAVNDIHNIKSEAELTNFIHRCRVLSQYESALLTNNDHWCR